MPRSRYRPTLPLPRIHSDGEIAPLAAPLLHLAELVATASRALRTGVKASAEAAGVSEPEVPVLRRCCLSPMGVGQKELGECLTVSSAHLSEILDALARRGLVVSRRLSSDRRRQVWQAAPEGRDAERRLLAALSDRVGHLAPRLDPAELASLAALLENTIALLQGPGPVLQAWQEGAAA